ncbi:hypothetical protein FKW77_004328 [Venturia effusa]|uniref:Uncharacterized protein n=1 Tax=Venturia effusa TaxID=50376 RepID=A0A517LK32_9PEZI|nr:hypothetical protein FKW77_004328 [Venturia effusa]
MGRGREYQTAREGKEHCANPGAYAPSESPQHASSDAKEFASDNLQHPSIQTCVHRGVRLPKICYLGSPLISIGISIISERAGNMPLRDKEVLTITGIAGHPDILAVSSPTIAVLSSVFQRLEHDTKQTRPQRRIMCHHILGGIASSNIRYFQILEN